MRADESWELGRCMGGADAFRPTGPAESTIGGVWCLGGRPGAYEDEGGRRSAMCEYLVRCVQGCGLAVVACSLSDCWHVERKRGIG